jgi:hypothetical protein
VSIRFVNRLARRHRRLLLLVGLGLTLGFAALSTHALLPDHDTGCSLCLCAGMIAVTAGAVLLRRTTPGRAAPLMLISMRSLAPIIGVLTEKTALGARAGPGATVVLRR